MGRGRHNPRPLLAIAATTAAATAMFAARRASTRRRAKAGGARHLAPTPPASQPARPRPPASSDPPTEAESVQAPAAGQPTAAPHPATDSQPTAVADSTVEPPAADQPGDEGGDAPEAGGESAGGEDSLEPQKNAGSGTGAPRHLADRPGRGRALVGVLVALGFVGVVGIGAMLVADAGSDETDASTGTTVPPRATSSEVVTTTTTVVVASPAEAFTGAAARLEDAGTFAYRGTVSASDVSAVRPSLWLAVDVTVEGETSLADGRVHEVAVAESGEATETVVAGVDVFGRSARTRDLLAGASYEGIPELSGTEPAAKGAAGLVQWLAGVAEPAAAGVDGQGRPVYRGVIPASVLGPTERGRRAVDAEVLLTLDRAGDPVHVEITTGPDGPPLRLALDLSGLGAPVDIEPPAEV